MNLSDSHFENLKNDPRSTTKIIQLAADEEDKDSYWDVVWILRARGSDEEFAAASRLCQSQSPKERSLGVDILAILGIPQRTWTQQCGDIRLMIAKWGTCASVCGVISIFNSLLNTQ